MCRCRATDGVPAGRAAQVTALQSLPTPPGWKDSPPDYRGSEWRSWENTGELRAIVTAHAIGGNRRGWYRVHCSTICGGRGTKITATVAAEHLQATLEAVCGWAERVAI